MAIRSSVGGRATVEELRDPLAALALDEEDALALLSQCRARAPATVVLPVPPFPEMKWSQARFAEVGQESGRCDARHYWIW